MKNHDDDYDYDYYDFYKNDKDKNKIARYDERLDNSEAGIKSAEDMEMEDNYTEMSNPGYMFYQAHGYGYGNKNNFNKHYADKKRNLRGNNSNMRSSPANHYQQSYGDKGRFGQEMYNDRKSPQSQESNKNFGQDVWKWYNHYKNRPTRKYSDIQHGYHNNKNYNHDHMHYSGMLPQVSSFATKHVTYSPQGITTAQHEPGRISGQYSNRNTRHGAKYRAGAKFPKTSAESNLGFPKDNFAMPFSKDTFFEKGHFTRDGAPYAKNVVYSRHYPKDVRNGGYHSRDRVHGSIFQDYQFSQRSGQPITEYPKSQPIVTNYAMDRYERHRNNPGYGYYYRPLTTGYYDYQPWVGQSRGFIV